MNKIGLIVADTDVEYLESLANYIRNSDFSTRFEIKLFSQVENLEQYLLSSERTNVLLVSEQLVPENVEDMKVDSIIILGEQPSLENNSNYIFKYQQLNNMLAEVISIYYERHGKSMNRRANDEDTKVVTVYSATGGTGKTTVAYNLAKELAGLDNQVFYLNLELIHSTPILFNTENNESAAPLLYYVKTNSDELLSKIDLIKSTDSKTNIDYFNFPISAEEMADLSTDDLELLINSLVEYSEYHYVVIDLESAINIRTLTALGKSDHVIWLLNNDIQSFHKTSYLIEELHALLKDGSFRERVTLVLNRYTGRMNEKLSEYELNINSFLPYVPEWKEVISGEQLATIPIFNKAILEIHNNLLLKDQYDNSERGNQYD